MQKWLEGYKAEIRWAVENNIEQSPRFGKMASIRKPKSRKSNKRNKRSCGSLCHKVNQSPYYNALCPYDNTYGERTVTGCVATAMAQVMKYWNHPTTGTGFHSYNHDTYGTLSANFGSTTYQWSQMPNTVSSSNNAVATLMYHCGVSVDMDYDQVKPVVVGLWLLVRLSNCYASAEDALKTYFGYKSTLQGVYKDDYTNTNWINLLKQNLMQDDQ